MSGTVIFFQSSWSMCGCQENTLVSFYQDEM